MALPTPPTARIQMLIRRPVHEVFEAFLEHGLELGLVTDHHPDADIQPPTTG